MIVCLVKLILSPTEEAEIPRTCQYLFHHHLSLQSKSLTELSRTFTMFRNVFLPSRGHTRMHAITYATQFFRPINVNSSRLLQKSRLACQRESGVTLVISRGDSNEMQHIMSPFASVNLRVNRRSLRRNEGQDIK